MSENFLVKKNYWTTCIVAFWWSHHHRIKEKDNQVSEREGEFSSLSIISIYCNRDQQQSMMIDSTHRPQSINVHKKTTDPMIIAIRLCTYSIVSHNTKVYSGMCGQFNWLCIPFLNILFTLIFFSHIMRNLNPLDSDQSSE